MIDNLPLPRVTSALPADILLNQRRAEINFKNIRGYHLNIVSVLNFGAKGDGATDDAAALTAAVAAWTAAGGGTILFPLGTYKVSSNISIGGYIRFEPGAKIKPDSGITVTVAATALIRSSTDWKDVSAGGAFTNSAGAWEFRVPTRTTSPTGGRIHHIGFPGNSIDETSGTSFVHGGASGFPHSLGASSELSVIGGGYDNQIGSTSSASTIAGGAHHRIAASTGHAFVGGGAYQEAYAAYAVLCGGTLNKNYSTFGFLGAGQENVLGDSGVTPLDQRSAVLCGGGFNIVEGLRSALVGGFQNQSIAEESFVGGGSNNVASGANSSVVGGDGNDATGAKSVVIGGADNLASGQAAMAGGESCTASANYAVAMGEFLEASAAGAWATGIRSKSDKRGQRSSAAGYFAAKGDAQMSDLVARILTTSSQTKNLDLDAGTSAPISLPNNTTWGFLVRLVARNIDTDAQNGAWKFEGCIKRDSNAASTAMVGDMEKVTYSEPSGWSCTVKADTTNGALQIEVSTDSSVTENIRWVARIELVEVSG